MTDINILSSSLAIKVLLSLLGGIIIFHFSILLGITPFNLVWGGLLQTKFQMYVFEFVSICINLLAMLIVGIKGRQLSIPLPNGVVSFFLWLFAILFTFNTIGNVFAQSLTEKLVFTPLTLLISVLFYRLAMSRL